MDLLWVGNYVEDGLIQAVDEVVDGPADIIVEPARFHDQPDALDGIEVWRVGWQVPGFPRIPVGGFATMPGRIVHNQDIAAALRGNRGIGFSEKGLKDFGVGMGNFQGKELAGPGADHAHDVHPKVVAVLS